MDSITQEQVPAELREKIAVAHAFAKTVLADLGRLKALDDELYVEYVDGWLRPLGAFDSIEAEGTILASADEASGYDAFGLVRCQIESAAGTLFDLPGVARQEVTE